MLENTILEDYSKKLEELEEHQTIQEFFDSQELPSLEDLMEEFAVEEVVPIEPSSDDEPDILFASDIDVLLDDEPAILFDNQSSDEFEDTSKKMASLENELIQTRNNLWIVEQEKQEWQTVCERVQGDLEKFRWRVERERSEHYAYAIISVVREFIPILDNFERALNTAESFYQSADAESIQFFNGLRLIYQQTHKFLSNLGVESVEAVGEHFNPQLHEAVEAQPSRTFPPDTVIEQVLRGFKLGDKLIRPAIVKVSVAHTDDEQQPQ